MNAAPSGLKAMILAAGRGQRMRPLTDTTPKPLLSVNGKPLIVWHLQRLAAAGITDIVINHAWLGQQIVDTLGDGRAFGVNIKYSAETSALETAGGIARALPLLGSEPFLVINGDIWCDWPLSKAPGLVKALQQNNARAHLVLVDNPVHHTKGDFYLDSNGQVHDNGEPRLTFAGIGVYDPTLFKSLNPDQAAPLAPLLRQSMHTGHVLGEHHQGSWLDVGTPARLGELARLLAQA